MLPFSYCLQTSSSTGDGGIFLYFPLKEKISGCVRPGRLTDGPYTSYDLNTLLKATAGQRRAVLVGQGDKLVGEVSRLVVAEACIQALDIDFTQGQIYEINSIEGEGPGSDPKRWKELFKAAQIQ
eukprot:TRINITY_DN5884_c0_g1_i1.p1 TRINITY_DN5884_c0_g1~~TRINITY_DN5884_c0_g1_i1.p1  ORF type:complete len:125 (-),score=22.02 TRINITY_DN5884_c0_g1_i1:256-630(-)